MVTERYSAVKHVTVSILAMALVMFVYEWLKDMLLGDISLWQSHFITIVFSAVVAGIISYFLSYRFEQTSLIKQQNRALLRYHHELEELNERLLKEKQKAEESDRLKTCFLNNISHEVRTPLNGLQGFMSLLMSKDVSPEKQKQYYRIILNSSDNLLFLMNNIIEYSALEAGTTQIKIRDFPVWELLSALSAAQYSPAQQENKVKMEFRTCPAEWTLRTDKQKVYSILTNLLSNAVKFTHEGKITVFAEQSPVRPGIIFTVSDTGIGISEENFRRISLPFRQAEEGDTRRYGGVGMGLPLSTNMAELLGGKLWFDSQIDKGSVFHVFIPDLHLPVE